MCSTTVEWRPTLAQNVRSPLVKQETWRRTCWPTQGESTQMCRMWKFISSTWKLETAHAHPQWGEATQVPTMRLCIFTHRRSKSSHQNTSLKKAKSMQMVRNFLQSQNQTLLDMCSPTVEWRPTLARYVRSLLVKQENWRRTCWHWELRTLRKYTNVQNVEIHLIDLETWNSTCSSTVGRSHTCAHNAVMHLHTLAL